MSVYHFRNTGSRQSVGKRSDYKVIQDVLRLAGAPERSAGYLLTSDPDAG